MFIQNHGSAYQVSTKTSFILYLLDHSIYIYCLRNMNIGKYIIDIISLGHSIISY